jgi:uncharacterized protein
VENRAKPRITEGANMGAVKLGLALLGISYLLVCAAMYMFQRDLQYFPTRTAPAPQSLGLTGVQAHRLTTSDGQEVDMWYAPAAPGRPTILFFHGNAGEMADRAPRLAAYQAAGYGAAFVSYRGYGGSTGTPSEAGFLQDARAAYYWLLAHDVPSAQIIVIGESLGTGVAVQLAATVPVGAVVLEAPYSAAVDIAAGLYPFLPVRLLMQDQFRSIDHIALVTAPLLILHGTDDRVIPVASGQVLFDAANAPKTLVTLPGAGHDALFTPALWQRELAHLATLFPG